MTPASVEQRVEAAAAEYLRAADAGSAPPRSEFLARYPDLAAELGEFLDDLAAIEVAASPLRAARPESQATPPITPNGRTVTYIGSDQLPIARARQPGTRFGGYELLGEIAQGGMGVVYKARQVELNREVALKLIRAGELADPADVKRFQSEAAAAAHLDHPNIVPIYEVGEHSGQQFYAMRLVEGGTLAGRMTEFAIPAGASRADARRRQVGVARVMATVARAVHYAHQRGILHRDLKPANILLDADGTPHVTDFGLARRIGKDSTLTKTGAIVGTPTYMAPEQARGREDVTTEADVYGIGAVLYYLLAGRPPFQGEDVLDTLCQVREREPVRPRAVRREVDRDLETVCLKCLEKDPANRYQSAAALAEDLDRWQAGEPVLACPPSPGYRFRKFARRNKTALAVTGMILFFMALLGGGGGWVVRDRVARQQRLTTQVDLILAEVNRLEREQKWPEALAAAERAEAALAGGEADDAVRRRVGDARRDVAFVAELDRIRQEHGAITVEGSVNHAGAARQYAVAFRDYGVDVEALPTDDAAAQLRRNPALAAPVTAALDDWVEARRNLGEGDQGWEPLVAVARGLDPDPLRDRFRAAGDRKVTEVQADLRRLAESIDIKSQSPATLVALARSLKRAQLTDSALRVLQDGQYVYPADFWLNFELGVQLLRRKDYLGARLYSAVAVSLRPDSAPAHVNLGNALQELKKLDEAAAEHRKAIGLDPKFAEPHNNLGFMLYLQGKLDEAVAEYRKAIEFEPKFTRARTNLVGALHVQGKGDEAVAECRRAVELDPKNAGAHHALGFALYLQRKPEEAVVEYRKAIELAPKFLWAHNELGNALRELNKLDEAVDEYRKAIELDPKYAPAHYNLGDALRRLGNLAEAIAVYKTAIELARGDADKHNDLAWLLATCADPKVRDPKRAVDHAKKGVDLRPGDGNLWNTLGVAQYRAGDWNAAITALGKSNELLKGELLSFNDFFLAMAQWQLGNKNEARTRYDQAVEWMEKNRPQDEELRRFRAEAESLLRVEQKQEPR